MSTTYKATRLQSQHARVSVCGHVCLKDSYSRISGEGLQMLRN